MADATERPNGAPAGAGGNRPPMPTVNWDDSNMTTSYANVVNAGSTREEVTLYFGTNKTWQQTADGALNVQLDHRIVLNPFAAKRLATLLGALLGEYEKRFGEIDIGRPQATAPDGQPVGANLARPPAAGG